MCQWSCANPMNLKKSSLVFEKHKKKQCQFIRIRRFSWTKLWQCRYWKVAPYLAIHFELYETTKNVTHIEKETLSIFFGVERFHEYLYGCIFIRINDNKPLKSIFNRSILFPLFVSSKFFNASKSMTSNSNIHLAKTC